MLQLLYQTGPLLTQPVVRLGIVAQTIELQLPSWLGGQWQEDQAESIGLGPIELVASLSPADPAAWAGITLTTALDVSTRPYGAHQTDPASWRQIDSVSALEGRCLIMGRLPVVVPNLRARLRLSLSGPLAADDAIRVEYGAWVPRLAVGL